MNPARPRRDPIARRIVRIFAAILAVMLPSVFLTLSMGFPDRDSPAETGAVSLAASRTVARTVAPTVARTAVGKTAVATTDTATTPPLEVVVNSMTPAMVRSNSRTVIKGVIRNSSGSAVSGIEIRPGLSTARYSSVTALEQALDPGQPIGTRPLTTRQVHLTDPVAPGAEIPWRMVLPPGFLDGWADGVFVLTLDARSAEDSAVAGSARLALSWFDADHGSTDHRMTFTWLWPLTAPPGRDAEGILINDQLPTELNPGGRLAELSVAAAANPGTVTWVIDPALLETAASMSTGFRVVGADGATGPTRPGTAAFDWLGRVKAATNNPDADVWALTYADADVDSLGPAKLGPDAVLANTLAPDATSRVLGRRVESVIGWPAGATLTSETIGLYRSADVEALILDRPGETDGGSVDPLASVGVKGSRITGVTGDPTLNRTLSGWTSVGEIKGVALRQLFLAQLAIMSQIDRKSTVVVVPDRTWSTSASVLGDLLREIPETPWLQTSTLTDLLTDRSPALTTRSPSSASGKRSSRLGSSYLKKIRTEQERVATFSEILAPPGDLAGEFETALLRAESVAWRFQRPNGRKLLDRISAQLAATRDRVRPVSGGQVTLASATSRVPVTVVNDLDVPVKVGVKLIGDPAVRLVQPDQVLIDIPPGQKVGTEIAVQLLGAGELPVELQLTTPAGRPYGEPTKLTLRTTAYGAAATYVVAAAFIALAVTIVISTVRRRRKLARLPDDPKPGNRGPTDDIPS